MKLILIYFLLIPSFLSGLNCIVRMCRYAIIEQLKVSGTILSTIDGVVVFMLIPSIYFVSILIFYFKGIERSCLKLFFCSVLGIIICNLCSYFIWGVMSKQLLTPDTETIQLFAIFTIAYILVSVISAGIILVHRYVK